MNEPNHSNSIDKIAKKIDRLNSTGVSNKIHIRSNPAEYLLSVARPVSQWLSHEQRWMDIGFGLLLLLMILLFNARAMITGGWLFGEAIRIHIPLFKFAADELSQGRFPFWNPYVYAGFPNYASSYGAPFYPFTLLFLVLPLVPASYLTSLLPYALCAIFLYAHLRDQKVSRYSAFLAGLIAALSGQMLERLGHTNILDGVGWFPAQLYFAHRLMQTGRLRHFWLLAIVSVLQVLVGNGQLVVYTFLAIGLYSITARLDLHSFWQSSYKTVLVGMALLLSLGLSAFFLLPAFQLTSESARSVPSYSLFSEGSFPPLMALTMIFPWGFGGGYPPFNIPYWGPLSQYWWEGIQYFGILVVPLTVVALKHARVDKRVRAYALLGAIIYLLALGENTALNRFLFLIPVYNLFRISSRYIILLGPIAGALAAIGLDYLRVNKLKFRKILLAAAIGGITMFVIAIVLTAISAPQTLTFYGYQLTRSGLGITSPGIIVPLLVLLIGSMLLTVLSRARHLYWVMSSAVLLTALIILDLGSFGWFFRGFGPEQKNLATENLSACVGTLPQPTSLDEVDRVGYVEQVYSPWGDCSSLYPMLAGRFSAGGNDLFVNRRYLELYSTDNGYGSTLQSETVIQHAPLVDVLGIRYILAQSQYPAIQRYSQIGYSRQRLVISVHPHQTLHFKLRPTIANSIGLISWMSDSTEVAQGETIGEIRLTMTDGSIYQLPILAGVNTSEGNWDAPVLRGKIQHGRIAIAENYSSGSEDFSFHSYVSEIPLARTLEISDIEFISQEDYATFVVDRVSLYNSEQQQSTALTLNDLLAGTGYYSNQTRDQSLAALQNPSALPRSWLVQETQVLAPEAIRTALLEGILPGGQAYDPARLALIEEGDTNTRIKYTQGGSAHVTSYQPGRITLRVSAPGDTFVVVNESLYQGWKATIDGVESRLLRTDYTLIGLEVPAGEHTITLWYEPSMFWIGLAIASVIALSGLIVSWDINRRRRLLSQPERMELR